MAEEEEIPKSRDTVKWFHDHKGYGFITPDDGGENLFVHHSSIQSNGFRTLCVSQLVEFHIALEQERTKAVHVPSPDGSPLDNKTPNVVIDAVIVTTVVGVTTVRRASTWRGNVAIPL
ncbi:hypothetical protein RHMOL_Rhmol10G0170700 [Rhododendron molle]|uniref:Uncharacterized protein n=1 Tax=Rhododendron molle TaxID=49168 RepID=A0ACC0M498_RHOML|nr:hypothetical protein RHMOL_Rhmol10G0170700 [Rhododendron molle]